MTRQRVNVARILGRVTTRRDALLGKEWRGRRAKGEKIRIEAHLSTSGINLHAQNAKGRFERQHEHNSNNKNPGIEDRRLRVSRPWRKLTGIYGRRRPLSLGEKFRMGHRSRRSSRRIVERQLVSGTPPQYRQRQRHYREHRGDGSAPTWRIYPHTYYNSRETRQSKGVIFFEFSIGESPRFSKNESPQLHYQGSNPQYLDANR
jgi:hypothetical protein